MTKAESDIAAKAQRHKVTEVQRYIENLDRMNGIDWPRMVGMGANGISDFI